MKIKVVGYDDNKKVHKVQWLDDNKDFSFNVQSSDGLIDFTLRIGTIINMDTSPMQYKTLLIGCSYDVDGVFYNYTRKNPPELELCIKSAQIL
jgi:hypothetical protein